VRRQQRQNQQERFRRERREQRKRQNRAWEQTDIPLARSRQRTLGLGLMACPSSSVQKRHKPPGNVDDRRRTRRRSGIRAGSPRRVCARRRSERRRPSAGRRFRCGRSGPTRQWRRSWRSRRGGGSSDKGRTGGRPSTPPHAAAGRRRRTPSRKFQDGSGNLTSRLRQRPEGTARSPCPTYVRAFRFDN
jgi:hypothetical protein